MTLRKRWPIDVLLAAFAALGVRLAWRLSVSETGWSPHLNLWANVAASLVGVERRSLRDRDPEQQAEFWLAEVERLRPSLDDPQIAIGAAWVLDAPQFGFARRLGIETASARIQEFESRCRGECLASIERAVRLDETNVELRRAHALLLFQSGFMSLDLDPRSDDWLATLDDCRRVDPDNALYDYLAALRLWKSAADYDVGDDGNYRLQIENEAAYRQGNERFAAGLAKPRLQFGTTGYAATMAFLKKTSVPPADHVSIGGSRNLEIPAIRLLYGILGWQRVQVDLEARAGRPVAAAAAARSVLQMADQLSADGNYWTLANHPPILRRWGLANLQDLHRNHPGVLTADQALQVSTDLDAARLESEVLGEVARRRAPSTYGTVNSADVSVPADLLAVIPMIAAQSLVIVIVPLAFLFYTLARICGPGVQSDAASLGWHRHAVAWLVALGASFAVLGVVPAEAGPEALRTWSVFGPIWLAYGVVLLGPLVLLGKRLEIPWMQLAALVAVTALPVIPLVCRVPVVDLVVSATAKFHPMVSVALLLLLAMACWAICRSLWQFVRSERHTRREKWLALGTVALMSLVAVPTTGAILALPGDVDLLTWIPPTQNREIPGLEIAELQRARGVEARWAWAFVQWHTHYGGVVAPLLAVGSLSVWVLIRRARSSEGGLGEILRSRKRTAIRLIGGTAAASCLVLSLLCLLVYFGTTPAVVEVMDTHHRIHYERLANPAHARAELANDIAAVRSDAELMARFRAEIEELNRQLAEQRRRDAAEQD